MSLGMNFCLCLDLMLTLWSPFTNQSKRLKFYLMGSFTCAFLETFSTWKSGKEICADGWNAFWSDLTNLISVIFLNVYITFALLSVIYSSRMLGRPGISQSIKVVFLRKNVCYIICFIIIWSFSLAGGYWYFLEMTPDKNMKNMPINRIYLPWNL